MKNLFRVIEIELNTACNRSCPYCPNSLFDKGALNKNKKIKWALFKKIIDELAELEFKGRISPHFYGEPLLNNDLEKFLLYIKKRIPQTTINIFTNGDYLNVTKFNLLKKVGVNKLNITAHSQNKNYLTNIKKIIDTNNKSNNKIEIEFTSLLVYDNRGGVLTLKKETDKKKCFFPSRDLIINYKGDVLLCCNDYFSKYIFGNLQKEKIINIWKNKNFKKIRKNIESGVYELDICKKCKKGFMEKYEKN